MKWNRETNRRKYETYGVLVTVLSLQMIVIYADGNFDVWDAAVGAVGFLFAAGYLWQVLPVNIIEVSLCSCIFSISLFVLVFVYNSSDVCGRRSKEFEECIAGMNAVSEITFLEGAAVMAASVVGLWYLFYVAHVVWRKFIEQS
ncbi:MAG: hypothetical protein WDZ83_02075 [Rhizobiaceae bacterium]